MDEKDDMVGGVIPPYSSDAPVDGCDEADRQLETYRVARRSSADASCPHPTDSSAR